jgi:CheY-like chemotaxis protein
MNEATRMPERSDDERTSGSISVDPSKQVEARLLLVDDRPANLIALEALLRPLGHELLSVTSGQSALDVAEVADFAAILLDV